MAKKSSKRPQRRAAVRTRPAPRAVRVAATRKAGTRKTAAPTAVTRKAVTRKVSTRKVSTRKVSTRKVSMRKAVDDSPAIRGAARSNADRLGKYVYCIVRNAKPLALGPIGIGVQPTAVYTVTYNELAAVVSDSPLAVLDPTRDNVLAHQRVNETVMQDHTVLPMSFGTVFKTRDDVAAFLRSAYEAFSGVLDKMQNKLEFGVKVIWDRDAVVEEIESENDDIHRLKGEIELQKGSTYFARMQYGRLVDAALQAKSADYIARIFDRLRDVAVASRNNRPIGDRMILNAAFLVTRDHEAKFDKRVKELGAQFPKLTFKYTGPWPPYNFVNIRLKLERA